MKKISTLFKKDPTNLGRVINEVNPENQWVFDGEAIATRKLDGTACAIIDGELYKPYDVKKIKTVPAGAIPCQEPDSITGHWPHWVKCVRGNPDDKYHWEGFDNHLGSFDNGTYELIGPKIQGNPEKSKDYYLIRHGSLLADFLTDISFDGIKEYLSHYDIEGIVFHHKTDGRMCKIRKSDFGIKREKL